MQKEVEGKKYKVVQEQLLQSLDGTTLNLDSCHVPLFLKFNRVGKLDLSYLGLVISSFEVVATFV